MRRIVTLAIVTCLLLVMSSCGPITVTTGKVPDYESSSFVVKPSSYYYQPLDIPQPPAGAEIVIEGYFNVEGGNKDVGFRVKAPSGSYLENIDKVSNRHEFHFTVHEGGPYTLYFDNGFSTFTSKQVTLAIRAYSR